MLDQRVFAPDSQLTTWFDVLLSFRTVSASLQYLFHILLQRRSPPMCGRATDWLGELGSNWKRWERWENISQTSQFTTGNFVCAAWLSETSAPVIFPFTEPYFLWQKQDGKLLLYLSLCRLPLRAISILSSCIKHEQLSVTSTLTLNHKKIAYHQKEKNSSHLSLLVVPFPS